MDDSDHSGSGKTVFISAGDISGDTHAGELVRRLRAKHPDSAFFGLGGSSLEATGCRLLFPPEKEPVMGFRRVLLRIPHFFSMLAGITQFLREKRPDLVILVDYPGLNMRIARIAKSLGIPVVYFICPQLWAWAPWRVRRFARLVDLALVIFPFEETYFRRHGVATHYIGHPVCDRKEKDLQEETEASLKGTGDILGLFPGSRKQELEANLPVMLNSAAAILKQYPGLVPVISHYDPTFLQQAAAMADRQQVKIKTLLGGMVQTAKRARVSMVCSGTATLEVAFAGAPMVVIYRTSRLACRLAPFLLTAPYICQVNLMAGRELVPELLLHHEAPEPVLAKILPLIADGPERNRMIVDLQDFHEHYYQPGAVARATEIISTNFYG